MMIDQDTPASGRLTIDLNALVGNWQAVGASATPAETAAVVKANAYGLGIEPVGRALWAAGCRTFFVAVPAEGAKLRDTLPEADIYVLAGLLPGSAAFLESRRLRPVLGSMAEIAEWLETRSSTGSSCALHVDTGMNRLGLTVDEALTLSQQTDVVEALSPSLIISHLVISEEQDNALNATQRDRFARVRSAFPHIKASLANSAGVFLGSNYHFDMVRPGIATYGATPGPGVPVPMKPVVTAEAQVILVREGRPGETVGYGALASLSRSSRIAILGVGYADGYHRRADLGPGQPRVFIRGQSAPLLGRISMDLTAIDVTDIPAVQRGDWAELFGPNIPVDEVAGYSRTVGYELLTGLGRRYSRHYIGLPAD